LSFPFYNLRKASPADAAFWRMCRFLGSSPEKS